MLTQHKRGRSANKFSKSQIRNLADLTKFCGLTANETICGFAFFGFVICGLNFCADLKLWQI